MNNRKILLPIFIIVALTQLYIPAKMIWDREDILETGTEFKFKSAPIDPYDPFMGKYITLRFNINTFRINNPQNYVMGDAIYVSLKTDRNGFAQIAGVSKEKPSDTKEFVKAEVGWASVIDTSYISINYSFNRYYMEESKAYEAELSYFESLRDSSKITYALVSVKNGGAVLKDVLIDEIPIREIVKSKQEEIID